MEDFVKRMYEESEALEEKFNALEVFIGSEKFKNTRKYQRDLLIVQHIAMKAYLDALNERIYDLVS